MCIFVAVALIEKRGEDALWVKVKVKVKVVTRNGTSCYSFLLIFLPHEPRGKDITYAALWFHERQQKRRTTTSNETPD